MRITILILGFKGLNKGFFEWCTSTGIEAFSYCLCSYRDDLPINLGETTAEYCKKSTSG